MNFVLSLRFRQSNLCSPFSSTCLFLLLRPPISEISATIDDIFPSSSDLFARQTREEKREKSVDIIASAHQSKPSRDETNGFAIRTFVANANAIETFLHQ